MTFQTMNNSDWKPSVQRPALEAFATGLAARLPGPWTSKYQRHAEYKDQYRTTNQLWDSGHVDYVVST